MTYSYDAGNRLTQALDSITGTITRGYDGLDPLTSEATPQGTVSYTYDAAGRRTSMTVAGQPVVNYTYDNANRLAQIAQGTSTVASGYDAANRRTTLTLPNGVVMSYSYDAGSQLTGITYALGATTLGNLSYAYDSGGRRSTMGGSFARTGLPLAVSTTAYNANNQLTQWGTANLFYDLNGNMTSDGVNSFVWNARNQLASMNLGSVSFQYDAFGRRVGKTISGATTNYLYDRGNVLEELSGGVATANLLSGGVDEVFTRTDAAGARNFLTDALGSTLALSDSIGTLQTQYTYEPFGNTTAAGAASGNSFQYTGRQNDGTGLYFYRARYYNPQLQRFISEDPVRLGGSDHNSYAYAGNDPVNRNHPSGLFAPPWHFEITTQAALLNGYSLADAMALAWETASVDFRGCPGPNCSQKPDAYHSNTHSMAGRKRNGKPQTCEQAFQGSQQQLTDDISSGDIPKALHTIEDAYAAGHQGFQFWPGGIPDAAHEVGDWNPSAADVAAATAAAAAFLADLNSNREQLRRGQPIDTSRYFPSSPCGNI